MTYVSGRCSPPLSASRCASSSAHTSPAGPVYVTNDVIPSAMATTSPAAAGRRRRDSRDASAQLRDSLATSDLLDDDDEAEEEETSGAASTAECSRLLRLVSRDVVRLDT